MPMRMQAVDRSHEKALKTLKKIWNPPFELLLSVVFALISSPALAEEAKTPPVKVISPSGYGHKIGLEYARTPEYKKEFEKACESAKTHCQNYLKEHPNTLGMAVVSDLDETLLDNRPYFEEVNKDFTWADFEKWVFKAKAPNLPATASFLKWAREQGFNIIFLTGRTENMRMVTTANLVRNKVAYDGLFMRGDNDRRPASKFKAETRRNIEKMGYKIVVNIGDQDSDLAGGVAMDGEKLPNKLYFVQ